MGRAAAIEAGAVTYFTGKACKSGHVSERYTSSGTCVECHKATKRSISASMSSARSIAIQQQCAPAYPAPVQDRQSVLAYLAGIFDGEGCVFIARPRAKGARGQWLLGHVLTLSVGMRDQEAIDLFVSTFGGVGKVRVKHDNAIHHVWRAQHRRARDVLEELMPNLRVKRTQAEVAIDFYDRCMRFRVRRLTNDHLQAREGYMLKLRALKKAGYSWVQH